MYIISGNSNPSLAKEISNELNENIIDVTVTRFADQEVFVEINENIRGKNIFVIQSTSNPANDNLMELLITIDALKRASAHTVTAVIPYFGYARQDRKVGPRTPISAKLVADVLTTAGIDRLLTIDLHAGQIQGFFNIPVDNLYAAPVITKDIKENYKDADLVIISPDVGGVVRARNIAKRINGDLAIVDKRRDKANVSEVMNIIGNIENRDCIIVDDIVDTAGTLCNAASALIDEGAKSVSAYITHGVLSGPAVERITNSKLKELVITDSIAPSDSIKDAKNIRILNLAPLIAEAIKRISSDSSVSSLFD
ncbi:MAG: phosphoribosylpyrophosphate synthetase [Rickettsiales bacterium]|nr:phosphoribosylpyrophosphate synthetase [Pelagibacterales bacterium]MBT35813.1 phosphoribosylpyrophosphate synthetase [Rickettsiales bacterium]|tara:strand:- start:775 stop:1707 length:933 start_codon:yes stop_codon:yes gene_type:complete